MDMKKILSTIDGANKSIADGSEMKKFMSIVTESATNRLSVSEQLTVQHYQKDITNPVLNKDKDATPSMIGKYFKQIEEELAESKQRYKDRAKQLAERVVSKMHEKTADVDSAVKDYISKGGEIKQGKASKGPRKSGMSMASKHIGGSGDKMKPSRTGRGSNPQGKPVVKVETILSNIRDLKGQLDEQISQLEEYYSAPPSDSMSPIPGKHHSDCKCKEVEEGLRDPKDNPCWKGYKPVGTKKKGGKTVPNCVPNSNESKMPFAGAKVGQKSGEPGQLRGRDKVDVKGTVLGSKEKSQKGLRNKLVGGSM
jgi:hypothetical protein